MNASVRGRVAGDASGTSARGSSSTSLRSNAPKPSALKTPRHGRDAGHAKRNDAVRPSVACWRDGAERSQTPVTASSLTQTDAWAGEAPVLAGLAAASGTGSNVSAGTSCARRL